MATNKQGYMANYKMELRVTALFLATGGEMCSVISGEPLKVTNNKVKGPGEVVFHHALELNGNRVNGSIGRLLELIANYWNVDPMTQEEHVEVHRERNNLREREYC